MKMKKISLVATYNAENKQAVKSLVSNPAVTGLHELILVNEGNTEDIIDPAATSCQQRVKSDPLTSPPTV